MLYSWKISNAYANWFNNTVSSEYSQYQESLQTSIIGQNGGKCHSERKALLIKKKNLHEFPVRRTHPTS